MSAEKINENEIIEKFPNLAKYYNREDYMLLGGCWRGRLVLHFFNYEDLRSGNSYFKKKDVGGVKVGFWKMTSSDNQYKWYRILKRDSKKYLLFLDRNGYFYLSPYRFTGRNMNVPARMRNESMLCDGNSYRKAHCR